MPELFTIPDLVSLMQVPQFDTYTATLVRRLVTKEIRREVGPAVYDAMADVSDFEGLALAVAKRSVLNPAGMRSIARQVDDFSRTDTFATETLLDVELTEADKERISQILGRATGAFTVRPYGQPDTCFPSLRR